MFKGSNENQNKGFKKVNQINTEMKQHAVIIILEDSACVC